MVGGDGDDDSDQVEKLNIDKDIIIKIMCNIDTNNDKIINNEDNNDLLKIAENAGLKGKDEQKVNTVNIVIAYLKYKQSNEDEKATYNDMVEDGIENNNFLPDNFKNLLEQSYNEWIQKGSCKKEVNTDDIELEEKKTEEKEEEKQDNKEEEEKEGAETTKDGEEENTVDEGQKTEDGAETTTDEQQENKDGEGQKTEGEAATTDEQEENELPGYLAKLFKISGDKKDKLNDDTIVYFKKDIDVSDKLLHLNNEALFEDFLKAEGGRRGDVADYKNELNNIEEKIEIEIGDKYYSLKKKENNKLRLIEKLIVRDIIQTQKKKKEKELKFKDSYFLTYVVGVLEDKEKENGRTLFRIENDEEKPGEEQLQQKEVEDTNTQEEKKEDDKETNVKEEEKEGEKKTEEQEEKEGEKKTEEQEVEDNEEKTQE